MDFTQVMAIQKFLIEVGEGEYCLGSPLSFRYLKYLSSDVYMSGPLLRSRVWNVFNLNYKQRENLKNWGPGLDLF